MYQHNKTLQKMIAAIVSISIPLLLVVGLYMFNGENCPCCGGKMYEDVTYNKPVYKCPKCNIEK